jgi:hypothetical protein
MLVCSIKFGQIVEIRGRKEVERRDMTQNNLQLQETGGSILINFRINFSPRILNAFKNGL